MLICIANEGVGQLSGVRGKHDHAILEASPQKVNLQLTEWRERTPDFCHEVNRNNSFPIKTRLSEEQTEERKKKTTQKAQQQAEPLCSDRLKKEDHQRLGISKVN
ncbi:uncharacterized [Tachysurus ichikawai]